MRTSRQPLLAIIGATATGKTALAVQLAREFPSVLISADSRQLYRGMDIVPGKDHPEGVSIVGIDILDPHDPGSVAVWYDTVTPIIRAAWEAGKLPIVVGGTGLYVKALLSGVDTMQVPPDPILRARVSGLSINELQEELAQIAPTRFAQMNESDRANPRRLLRALEIAHASTSSKESRKVDCRPDSTLIIGLRFADPQLQAARIAARVQARLAAGALAETAQLVQGGASLQALSALGYAQIRAYLAQELSYDDMVHAWTKAEIAYVKRQKTWFAKMMGIQWYDVETLEIDQVVQHLKAWYDKH